MGTLSTTEIILGIIVATVGIQVTIGGLIARVLWSQYGQLKESYERQLGFLDGNLTLTAGQRDRAERQLADCQDDLEGCREHVHQMNGGFRV